MLKCIMTWIGLVLRLSAKVTYWDAIVILTIDDADDHKATTNENGVISFRMVIRWAINKLRHFYWPLPRSADSTANTNDVGRRTILNATAPSSRILVHAVLRIFATPMLPVDS